MTRISTPARAGCQAAVRLASVIVMMAGASPAGQSATVASELTVVVEGMDSAAGTVGIAVWTAPTGFPEQIQHAVTSTYVGIVEGRAVAVFPGLFPGVHAVTAFHDENDNRRFDRSWIGRPLEAWGVSNGVRPRLRAPRFDEARFALTAGLHRISIEVD